MDYNLRSHLHENLGLHAPQPILLIVVHTVAFATNLFRVATHYATLWWDDFFATAATFSDAVLCIRLIIYSQKRNTPLNNTVSNGLSLFSLSGLHEPAY
ncbi:hypothetical protein JR316_0006735 [Psilocybe cubensis]|uniref:Uncharacterized protein n=2 Tax=Psilocybe cubensis TaxID=181762 RepID=A0ACB8GWL8_PSICU|nr:hypothetical protein JR316_0009535 [Psilocybe cubensis]XP_047747763.1 hypothetical protein JR316_0006735 [Psilocybe cubensis]KAH9477330.1 hypothetical protein JR316_0009535 [Psilocybe cubensis]KAH9480138.1 hypothetical protein JR316_0006735 [Psilocybe cubensis]